MKGKHTLVELGLGETLKQCDEWTQMSTIPVEFHSVK